MRGREGAAEAGGSRSATAWLEEVVCGVVVVVVEEEEEEGMVERSREA